MEERLHIAHFTVDVSSTLKPILFTIRLKWYRGLELTKEAFLLNQYKSSQFSDCKKCSFLIPWESKVPKSGMADLIPVRQGVPHATPSCEVLHIHLLSPILFPSLHVDLLLTSILKKI